MQVGLAPSSPVLQLVGLRLNDRWDVLSLDDLHDGESGRNFSVCYLVADAQYPDRRFFLKAIDLYRLMQNSQNIIADLRPHIEKFDFEERISKYCRGQDRVVTAVDTGQYNPPNQLIPIPYMVFELGEGDMNRKLAAQGNAITFAWKVRAFHHIATGIRQLHNKAIAHQDLKPSNVVVFTEASKVADLGRASWKGVEGPFDESLFPGDQGYAPPEFRYSSPPVEFERRRFGADIYMLGAMGVYMFTQLHLNVIIEQEVSPEHRPRAWNGLYEVVLPYYREAFYRALKKIEDLLPNDKIGKELSHIFTWLCEPDPMQRGYVKLGEAQPTQYSLNRLITRLDYLAGLAQVEARRLQKAHDK